MAGLGLGLQNCDEDEVEGMDGLLQLMAFGPPLSLHRTSAASKPSSVRQTPREQFTAAINNAPVLLAVQTAKYILPIGGARAPVVQNNMMNEYGQLLFKVLSGSSQIIDLRFALLGLVDRYRLSNSKVRLLKSCYIDLSTSTVCALHVIQENRIWLLCSRNNAQQCTAARREHCMFRNTDKYCAMWQG